MRMVLFGRRVWETLRTRLPFSFAVVGFSVVSVVSDRTRQFFGLVAYWIEIYWNVLATHEANDCLEGPNTRGFPIAASDLSTETPPLGLDASVRRHPP